MTDTTKATLDFSRVSELEKRQQAKALLDEIDAIEAEGRGPDWKAAMAAARAADKAERDEVNVVREKHLPLVQAAWDAVKAAGKREEQRTQPLRDALDALDLPFDMGGDYDDTIQRCAVSGLPLLEDDEIWESDEHGKALLCLMLPADYEEEEAEQGDEDDEALELPEPV